jgi:hypothetical protein
MTKLHPLLCFALAGLAMSADRAHAFTFGTEDITGSIDSTVSIGTGIRTGNPSCTLILAGATGAGAPAGCLSPTSALGDQGDLNYAKGDRFTTFLKGTHELLVKMPSQDITFMTRVLWTKDFSATHTTGYESVVNPGEPAVTNGLSDAARDDLRFKARLLDFWVSKSFAIGDQQARVRVGNQVISWGESLFLPGGINSTNAVDIMKLSQPGTQLKEAILPAPIASFTTGLGHGLNFEAYVQARWNASYFPPTGSYWSDANGLGKGDYAYGLSTTKARNGGQWGASLRYQPDGTQINLGFYAMNYHDKAPSFSLNTNNTGTIGWTYPEDRKLYGISANFPVGDWAVGTEVSYRPREAVPLNAAVSGCASQNGNCWVDSRKVQAALTGMFSATPSNAKGMLDFLKADTATLMVEAVGIHYPDLQQTYGGDPIAAGAWGWGQETDPAGTPIPVGSKTSYGYNFDFSWVYDGTLIPGWQVVPEVYFFHALKGRTPNGAGTFMEGAKSVNFTISFIQNPATWQAAINYAKFWGGTTVFDQPYRDRDFVGLTLSRNF